jgi:hypothetical protein
MKYRFETGETVRIIGTPFVGEIIIKQGYQMGSGVFLDYYTIKCNNGVTRCDVGGGHLQKLHSLEEMVKIVGEPPPLER